jgi:hypothetical protein
VGGFASFCWEMQEKNNETHCRPLFLVSDAFVKTFRVRRPRIHRIPQLTPTEEVNFSLLAIKFSKNLTKDMIFSGVRDIVRKIGEYIFRGYELQIRFTFGTLYAKESRVKFTFSQSRLVEVSITKAYGQLKLFLLLSIDYRSCRKMHNLVCMQRLMAQ